MEQRKANWLVLASSMILLLVGTALLFSLVGMPLQREPQAADYPPIERIALFPEVYKDPDMLDIYLHDATQMVKGPDGKPYAYDRLESKLYRVEDETVDMILIGDVVKVKGIPSTGLATGDGTAKLLVVGADGRPLGEISDGRYLLK